MIGTTEYITCSTEHVISRAESINYRVEASRAALLSGCREGGTPLPVVEGAARGSLMSGRRGRRLICDA
jgi:hypothetical protein